MLVTLLTGKSTVIVFGIKKASYKKELASGTFLNIPGTFHNTSFDSTTCTSQEQRNIFPISSILSNREVTVSVNKLYVKTNGRGYPPKREGRAFFPPVVVVK